MKKGKKYLSVVKRIEKWFLIKSTLNKKVHSGRTRTSTINEDRKLKMTVMKENFF